MLHGHRSKRLKVLQDRPDGFQKPSSVLRGFAGWETLKCFEISPRRQKGAKEHEGRKKPLALCFVFRVSACLAEGGFRF